MTQKSLKVLRLVALAVFLSGIAILLVLTVSDRGPGSTALAVYDRGVGSNIQRGNLQITLNETSVALEAGKTATIAVTANHWRDSQLPGCEMAECPNSCGEKNCLASDGINCTCGGATAQTYSTVVTVSSSNSAAATASYSNEQVTITGVAAGTATITVTGKLREWTQDAEQIAVTVAATGTGSTVNVTSVTLNMHTDTLNPDGTAQLTATIAPADATNQSLTWSSSNAAAATVSQTGLVTAVAAGTANITVTTKDGNKTDTCAVTVQAASSVGGGGGVAVSFAPSVQTLAASSITATSAVLNGNVTSSGGYNITDYGFLWGTSAGSLTSKQDVGTNNQSGAYTGKLGSLTTGTTYYFEAYATNSQGTAQGAILSFTATSAAAPQTATTPTTRVAPPAAFNDVSVSYWAYNAITSLNNKGVVSGYPDETFKPDASVTRAEFAAMLVKALGLSTTGTAGNFTDVGSDSWCYGAINGASTAGLVSGTGDHLFAPNSLITREQMAVMAAKALGAKAPTVDGTELNSFSDKSAVSNWAVTGMEEAVKAGIINGVTNDTLAPLDNATRAQAAAMIYKMLSILGK